MDVILTELPAPASLANDPTYTDEQLEDEVTLLTGHINASTYRLLTLIGDFDNRCAWGDWGIKSCAHWLSWKCGIALSAAREKVRVAHALAELPLIAESFERGEASYSKVRAMIRVANEDYLLHIARNGTASHVEKLVRAYRKAERYEAEREAATTVREHPLGCKRRFRGNVRLPTSPRSHRPIAARNDRPGRDVTFRQRRADAPLLMAETLPEHEPTASAGGDRYQLMVHIDAERLSSPPIPSVASRATRAWLSSTRTKAATSSTSAARPAASHPRYAARSRPATMAAASPAATRPASSDCHHIHHWADGGEDGVLARVFVEPQHRGAGRLMEARTNLLVGSTRRAFGRTRNRAAKRGVGVLAEHPGVVERRAAHGGERQWRGGSSRCSRIRATLAGSVTHAMRLLASAQLGQANGNAS